MKKNAFTLAEVLITLGILGVIAALTLPSINNTANRAKTGPELAAAISTLSEATARFMTDYNADYIPVALTKASVTNSENNPDTTLQALLTTLLNKNYIKGVAKTLPSSSLAYNGTTEGGLGGGAGIVLANKSAISIAAGETACNFSTSTDCDVIFFNSSYQKAHRLGKLTTAKEVFKFTINRNGEVRVPESWTNCTDDGMEAATDTGVDCSGRIAENGWKVDY